MEALRGEVAAVPHWFHSIDLGDGVVTPGDKSVEVLSRELVSLRLPDLRGLSVLDIGAWDGFYSFTAERLGAARVVSMDHFVWSLDRARANHHISEWSSGRGSPRAYEETDAWKPAELPGKRGYDLAHRVLGSRAEPVVADFMTEDLRKHSGPFDVVLWLGVLYHMRHPLLALEKVRSATRRLAVIETEAIEVHGAGDTALCEFFERDELAGDFTNWWAPNEKALVGMCRAAGFSRVEVIHAPGESPASRRDAFVGALKGSTKQMLRELRLRDDHVRRYRIVVHARP